MRREDETERHETSKDESEDESVSEEDHEMEVEYDEGSGSVYETDIETTETETEDDLDKTNRLVDCSIYYIDGSVLLENLTKIWLKSKVSKQEKNILENFNVLAKVWTRGFRGSIPVY